MPIEGREFSGKEKRLNNCYQQLIRRISSDVVYILKWFMNYATFRGKYQDSKRRSIMFLDQHIEINLGKEAYYVQNQ